jgi:hypothetical protein
MLAKLLKDGTLQVIAENQTEQYALRHWRDRFLGTDPDRLTDRAVVIQIVCDQDDLP